MKKRFIVLIEESSEEQDNSFLEWVKSEKIGWWHWFQHAWLLSNRSGNFTASDIRDKLHDVYGTANNLVIELNETDDTWSGFGPKNENNDMFKWIKDNWHKQ